MNPYPKFAAMISTSTLVMFGLMYLNAYALDHVFSARRDARLHGAGDGSDHGHHHAAFMLGMYRNAKANLGIFAGSAVVFALALWLVRSQATVGDVSWMRAMIPHHSIAILTSERAKITDPRVRKLADQIIEAQRREIGEMKALIQELEKSGD